MSDQPAKKLIAFLRAINVGGHTVKMEQLRKLFAELELANVETFIASGNVIFDAPDEPVDKLERRIEAYLKDALGYAVATFIRTPAELAAIVAYDPFPDEAPSDKAGIYIGFMGDSPSKEAIKKLLDLSNDSDVFHVRGREIYWLGRQGMGRSTVSGAKVEKTIGMQATMRNTTTVTKLAAKYKEV